MRYVGTRTLSRDPGALASSGSSDQTSLPFWLAGVANVRSGAARAKLVFIGDSTTGGLGGGTGGASKLTGAWARCFPKKTAEILNRNFVETNPNTFCGSQNFEGIIAFNSYDPRITLGTNWSLAGGSTLGDNFAKFTASGAGTLAFTPANSFDKIEIWYWQNTGYGSVAVNVDGGATLATINTAGTSGLASTTVTCSAGTHTINLVAANDGDLYVGIIIPYLSTTPAVDVVSGGWSGAGVANLAAGGVVGPLTAIRALAPACTVINCTINDASAGTNLTTYSTLMQTIIDAGKASGDVILMVGPPGAAGASINGTLERYVAVIYSLAANNGCAVVDIKERWGSYAAIQPYLPYYDTIHPAAAGYADMGQAVATALMFE